jgi:membrane associated rhomboid family serine protease
MAHHSREAVRAAPVDGSASRPSRRDVSVVCGLMCVAATAGVVGLARGSIDFGPEITARLPAASPVLGAVALGVVVALPMGAAAVAGWRRSPRTADLAILAGTALVGWIAVEVAFIRSFSWLQPACAVYGGVVLALGLLLRRSAARRRGI